MSEIYKNKSLQDIDGEIWLPVVGLEDIYEVSNMGRVKSLEREIERVGKGNFIAKTRIMSQHLDGGKYLGLHLARKYAHVHRLVGIAFIPNPLNLAEINHIKGVKTDNRASQLEWATKSYNIKHAFAAGLNKSKFQNFGEGNPKSKPVSQYSKDGAYIKTFSGQAEAERETGADQAAIWRVCNGKNMTAGGYIWKYAEGFGLGRKGGSIYERKEAI